MDFHSVEKKWQQRWEKAKLFEATPSRRKKFFTSLIIPYVNGNIHIGHSFTYSRTDAYARFKRMQGYNTLLAQGFHATGEPILGAIERLQKNDKSQIETFRMFGATDRDLALFRKKGAEYAVQFWSKKIIESEKRLGFSIDWRRKFITAVEPAFNRFIEWQYHTLREKGYVVQGTHPVIWCPRCKSPTGDHDRLQGEGESPVDYVLLKFSCGDFILPAATLRPETIYGVTNMWVNPDAEYLKVNVAGETWVISQQAGEKLADQLKNMTVVGRVHGRDLLGTRCINPLTSERIPVLPGPFVKLDHTTGVVMSVPSHAPYDWIAIKELTDRNALEQYGTSRRELAPRSVVATPGFGDHPAVDLCAQMNITSLKQEKELDEATGAVYKKEFHTGILNRNCGAYAGLKVSECKEKLVLDLIDKGVADLMWETTGPVVCRCTTPNHVKILENQWFLKYSDMEWKKRVRRCLAQMKMYPEEARQNFENTIDWLKDKACTRRTGLGTPLPWDTSWIVETLSDSTVYMAYYTIAGVINRKKIPVAKLTDEVFNYVFLSRGDKKAVARRSTLPLAVLQQMKDEFEYFYPVDFRNSAKELIQNHLTFFLFQHVAIWPEKYWPRAIGANGFVSVEGDKMSKSKGNIIPLATLVSQYGADLTRINIITSSEGMDDADWRAENINSFRSRIEFLIDLAAALRKMKKSKLSLLDKHLMSRMQKCTRHATAHYEQTRFRSACQHALFDTVNALRWYRRRGGKNRAVLQKAGETVAKLLAPLIPHAAEELWKNLGNKGFISVAAWPAYDASLVNEQAEKSEEFLVRLLEDTEEIRALVKTKPEKVTVFVGEEWKFDVYDAVLKNKAKDVNEITKQIMSSGKYSNATVAFIQGLYKRINQLEPVIGRAQQLALLEGARLFLEKELKCIVVVVPAEKSTQAKARAATPQKPGILLE